MKKALITGASRGIGRAIAEKLKDEYELFLICRKNTELLTGSTHDFPAKHLYTGDAGDNRFIEDVFGDISSLDLLVNNAGIAHFDLIQDTAPADWDDVIRTDLTSVYNTCRCASRLMISRHEGRIINISSVWGTSGAACESAYAAAKGGINAFTRSLAKELAPSGISVNAIAPGVIDTDMNKRFSAEETAAIVEQIPACRLGTPGEIADAVYLLSKMPVYLTGQIIAVDGGYLI